jgi:hypothetical protein
MHGPMSVDADRPRERSLVQVIGRLWKLQRISRVLSGIRADTISDAWPHVGQCGSSELEQSLVV